MDRPLFVGIDIGTSACRALAIDEGGSVAGQAAVPLPPPVVDGPAVTQDPVVWWTALTQACRTLGDCVPLGAVQAVAVDGTSATLLAVDAGGRPMGPALLYNDARADAEARRIAAVAPPESGAHGASSALAKFLYVRGHGGAALRAMHQADWVTARLSGRDGVSDENNCLKLGYDPVQRAWPSWLTALGVPPSALPQVVSAGTALGTLTSAAAAVTGLGGGALVCAGTTDSVAAFIASGAERPGEAVTSLGSTLVLKVAAPAPVFAPAYGVYSHRLGARWLAGGASNSGGAVLRRYFSDAQMATLMQDLSPDEGTGLDYYPLAAPGERFPVNDPRLAPRLTPRPADDRRFFQGMLEGIAAIERDGYRRLAQLGAPYPASVRTLGGGAHNAAWTAIRGRMLGVPMLAARHHEAAYGAALLALQGWQSARP